MTSVLFSTAGSCATGAGTEHIAFAFNNLTVGGIAAAENQIHLYPRLRTGNASTAAVTLAAAWAAGTSGSLDWACVSETALTANNPARNLGSITAAGSAGVRAKYSPAECR